MDTKLYISREQIKMEGYISFDSAMERALKHVNRLNRRRDDFIIIVKYQLLKNNKGWLFFYDSNKFLETNAISYALAGNGPLIITNSGELVQLGALRWEKELEDYESPIS